MIEYLFEFAALLGIAVDCDAAADGMEAFRDAGGESGGDKVEACRIADRTHAATLAWTREQMAGEGVIGFAGMIRRAAA